MSVAKDPESFPQRALHSASHALHHRLHYMRLTHPPFARRHNRTCDCQLLSKRDLRRDVILESSVFIGSCSSLNDVCSCRLAYAQIEKRRDDSGISYISGVDECSRGRVGELRKAESGLLRSYKRAYGVDGQISSEVGQREHERVIWRVGCGSTDLKKNTAFYPYQPYLAENYENQPHFIKYY